MSLRALFLTILLCLSGPARAQDEDHEGGIIGTGIVGTITHLGSIYVNGQHILIDPEMDVSGTVTPMTAAGLRPGHIVAVTARPDGTDWRAQHIRQILPLVGPVEAIERKTLTVMGTRVELDAQTASPELGEWVAISGLWQGSVVKGSRLDPVPEAQRQARISGTYFGADAEGNQLIGDTKISGIKTEHLESGDLVRVFGQPVASGIGATRLERHLFEDSIQITQAEGYLSKPQPSGLYTILGSGLVAYTDQPEMINPESKVTLCGRNGQLANLADGSEGMREVQHILQRLNCTS